MSTETYNSLTIVLWTLTLLAGLATVTVYLFQLRAMHKAIRAQNLAWLVQYLQAPNEREARHIVLTQIRTTLSPGEWHPDHRRAAGTACAAYSIAAVFVELNRVDKDVIVNNWGPSIWAVGKVCEHYIADQRRQMGEAYWRALAALIKELGD